MYTIQTLNKIAAAGTKRFDTAAYTVTDTAENPDAIMVRSAAMHDMTFGSNLLAIARAGAGTNNIPVDRCAEAGICVFNTPGANANAVKELVLTGLLLSSRKIPQAIAWAHSLEHEEGIAKLVEKARASLQVRKSRARPSVLSVWVQLVHWLPMQPSHWACRLSEQTRSCPLVQHFA